jgi:hypothetical protein
MRWERLFDDLEAQLDAAENEELAAEVADRSRREAARLRFVDRLRGNAGRPVVVTIPGGQVEGWIGRVGADWVLLETHQKADVLVPLAAVLLVQRLGSVSAEPGSEGAVSARLGLGHVLRAVARDRSEVSVFLTDSSRRTGRIDRVGADFLELAAHEPGEPGRVTETLTVPFCALAAVRAVPYA